MENLENKNENIGRKHLENKITNFYRNKNSFIESGKDFMKLKDRGLKDRKELI